jgi:hypothetical protein
VLIDEKLNNIEINFSPQLKKNNQKRKKIIDEVFDKI